MDIFDPAYAAELDKSDALADLRKEFHIPTRGDISGQTDDKEECTYLCGNSLGLQPKRTATYAKEYLQTWATKGVYGHFTKSPEQTLPPWVDVDEGVVPDMAKIVGAEPKEVAVMQTLTGNLHLALCSFYRPTETRYKIIIEGKAFPSDHYAVESQIRLHNLNPKDAMVMLVPNTPMRPILSTKHIMRVIDENASSTALLLLPGVQFYTGQYFDIPAITAHAQKHGIVVGWDLAHAVGNVPLQLHDWNVDFAVWCNYKYMNSGPGAIGGFFVHARQSEQQRLAGWWGSDKKSRFSMDNTFTPIPGAAGFQLSNPSVGDMTFLRASLDVFNMTSMKGMREKSLKLTRYLEQLLHEMEIDKGTFEIITPSDPKQRGAQLSLRLAPGMLDEVMKVLEAQGVVIDERRPDVIRVGPAPLYNNFSDVLRFVNVFKEACVQAAGMRQRRASSMSGATRPVMHEVGGEKRGWSEIQ
ncbi:hypothetical protein AAFC00_001578 [Neodothiora populina]|uniref:Kynureninase n=1 Tax=Neodothiora populina TaxID=2781224 RepID=A0ABR3PPD6_9PEZI